MIIMKTLFKTTVALIIMTLSFSCSSEDDSVEEAANVSFQATQQLKSDYTLDESGITGKCASTSYKGCGFYCIICATYYEAKTVSGQALLYSLKGNCKVCNSPFPEAAGVLAQ